VEEVLDRIEGRHDGIVTRCPQHFPGYSPATRTIGLINTIDAVGTLEATIAR
jgi:hypothetical protein